MGGRLNNRRISTPGGGGLANFDGAGGGPTSRLQQRIHSLGGGHDVAVVAAAAVAASARGVIDDMDAMDIASPRNRTMVSAPAMRKESS